MEHEPQCVFTTSDPSLGDVVVAWLADQGIDARIVHQRASDTVLGSAPLFYTEGQKPGIELWVQDEDHAIVARKLLADHARFHAEHTAGVSTLTATCEECSTTSTFPGDTAGSVQECPNCGAYIDVPDPHAEASPLGSEAFENEVPE